jgi:hypothetical protein
MSYNEPPWLPSQHSVTCPGNEHSGQRVISVIQDYGVWLARLQNCPIHAPWGSPQMHRAWAPQRDLSIVLQQL